MYIYTPPSYHHDPAYQTSAGPSADPAMWAGSFLAQREAEEMALARQWDDIDMEQAEYTAKHEDYEVSAPIMEGSDITGKRLITLDTNVLINHLDLVRRVFIALSSSGSDMSLLLPTVVINELDSLASPRSYDSPPSSSSSYQPTSTSPTLARARQATSWLLSINRGKRESPTAPQAIRCQRWSERGQGDMRKADDRVLDCCLTFRKMGAGEVILWTEDRNLSLLAEANDISTIPSPTPGLGRMLRLLGIESESNEEDLLVPITEDIIDYHGKSTNDNDTNNEDIDDMQIEPEFDPVVYTSLEPSSSHTAKQHITDDPTSLYSNHASGQSSPTFLILPSRYPRHTPSMIPTNMLARLNHLADLISSYLPSDPTQFPSYDPSSAFSSLIARLDSTPPGRSSSVDYTRTFYMLLSALMTIQAWIRDHDSENARGVGKGKGIRSGEAADAVCRVCECLPVVLPDIAVLEDDVWWRLLEKDIRAL